MAMLISCQGLQLTPRSKRELLEQRVHGYVEARKNNDMEQEYKFHPPSYRQSISLEQFKERRKIKIEKLALKSIAYEEDADSARVVLLLDFRVMGFQFKELNFPQEWLLIDGQWYVKVRPVTAKDLFRKPKDRFKEIKQ
jgi:hypothetical protein